jgi:hypothetical protein
MSDSLFIATVVLTFAFLTIVIIKADRKPKWEIRYINGWFVIQHSKSKEPIQRFRNQEQAEIWFNENCNQL